MNEQCDTRVQNKCKDGTRWSLENLAKKGRPSIKEGKYFHISNMNEQRCTTSISEEDFSKLKENASSYTEESDSTGFPMQRIYNEKTKENVVRGDGFCLLHAFLMGYAHAMNTEPPYDTVNLRNRLVDELFSTTSGFMDDSNALNSLVTQLLTNHLHTIEEGDLVASILVQIFPNVKLHIMYLDTIKKEYKIHTYGDGVNNIYISSNRVHYSLHIPEKKLHDAAVEYAQENAHPTNKQETIPENIILESYPQGYTQVVSKS